MAPENWWLQLGTELQDESFNEAGAEWPRKTARSPIGHGR